MDLDQTDHSRIPPFVFDQRPGVVQPNDDQSGKNLGRGSICDWSDKDSSDRQNLEVLAPSLAEFEYLLPSHTADPVEQDQIRWAEEQILLQSSAGDTGGPSDTTGRKHDAPSEPPVNPAPAPRKTKITTKIIKKAGIKPGEGVKRKRVPESAA